MVSFTCLPLPALFEDFYNDVTMVHGEMSLERATELLQALLVEFEMEVVRGEIRSAVIQKDESSA